MPVEAVVALLRVAMVIAADGGEEYIRLSISPLAQEVARLDPGVPARGIGGRDEVGFVSGGTGEGYGDVAG